MASVVLKLFAGKGTGLTDGRRDKAATICYPTMFWLIKLVAGLNLTSLPHKHPDWWNLLTFNRSVVW